MTDAITVTPARRLAHTPPYLFARLDGIVAAKRAAGERVVSLGMGDPDQPTFPKIVEAGVAAMREPRNHHYPTNRGRPEFRAAVAEFYGRRFGVALDPEREVLPVLGAKECLANLCAAFLDPSSVAIVPDPGYPVYRVATQLAGARAVGLPLRANAGFAPHLDAVAASDAAQAKLMFLNYPNNPTGAVVSAGTFADAIAFARAHDVVLVHDNPYSEVGYEGYRAPSVLATPGAAGVAIEVFSFSKAYNMAGWRCGALVGAADVLDHYWRLKSHLDVGVFDVVQLAAARALSPDLDEDVHARNARYARRRDAVVTMLRGFGCGLEPPRATIYVWAPVPAGFATATEFTEHALNEVGVVLTPGSVYGTGGEGWFRISLGCPDAELDEALDRLAALPLTWSNDQEARSMHGNMEAGA